MRRTMHCVEWAHDASLIKGLFQHKAPLRMPLSRGSFNAPGEVLLPFSQR